jgi:hypothetical protein
MPWHALGARTLAPALLLALAACDAPSGSAVLERRLLAEDPPELWRAEAVDAAGRAAGAVHICTNRNLRAGLVRANAEVNGTTCAPRRDPVERPGLYAVRCQLGGKTFGLTVNTTGDLARDFTARSSFTGLYGRDDVRAVQTRHYTRLGPCPAGWKVGDQGPPGGERTGNALDDMS